MRNKILLVSSIIMGLLMILAGASKLYPFMPEPQDLSPEVMEVMKNFKAIVWLMPLVGVAELVGGILVMIKRYQALGSLILFPILVGILLHCIYYDPSSLPMAIGLWIIEIFIIVSNKRKFLPLIEN